MRVEMIVLSFFIYCSLFFGRWWVECVELIFSTHCCVAATNGVICNNCLRLPLQKPQKKKKVKRFMLSTFLNLYFTFETPVVKPHTINLRDKKVEKTAYFTIYFKHPAGTLSCCSAESDALLDFYTFESEQSQAAVVPLTPLWKKR